MSRGTEIIETAPATGSSEATIMVSVSASPRLGPESTPRRSTVKRPSGAAVAVGSGSRGAPGGGRRCGRKRLEGVAGKRAEVGIGRARLDRRRFVRLVRRQEDPGRGLA